MPIAPVLQRFVDDELSRTPALVERVVAGCLQLLRDTRDSRLTAAERTQQFAIVEALQANVLAYQRAFATALQTGVRAALDEHGDGLPTEAPLPDGGLELMDESRVEIDIEISRAMQLIDTTAEWELRELQTFTSTLIGQTHVSAESNPLRPAVYASALWEAACAVSPVQVHRATLLRTSAGVAAGLLKHAWAAACTRLEAQGVEPGIYRTMLLPPGAAPGRGPAPADPAKPGAMANLLSSMPGGSTNFLSGVGKAAGAMGTSAPPRVATLPLTPASPEFEHALARLDELLRHLPQAAGGSFRDQAATLVKRLNLHRAALVASAAEPIERQTIEMLSRLFDSILSDAQVPPAFAAVLARLQTSVLRVALHDPELLASTQHPVWRLLDGIGAAVAAYPQPNDVRATALLSFCHTLAEPLARAPTPDATLYRRAQSQLEAFLNDQRRGQLRAAQPALQTLQLAERRETLQQQLSLRLTEQMAPTRTSPGIRRFVTGAWARVLAESMLRDGEQGPTTRGYIKLVDELLWSVRLPDHPQSRQRLIALLPGLLQRLRAGMALINLPAAEQNSVLDELMAVHAEALRPGARAEPATLTSAQIVQRMRDEVLPPTTGHGGFSDSVIDLGSMETVPAELMPESPTDELAKRVDALREADRLRLFLHGRWARVQLLWRSDQGLFFLFAGENPARTHSVTHRALEKLAAAGLMQPLEARSLVQRALDNVTRELVRPS
ncbi:MAG: DUF1631 family protein [Burkholderiales bacterium]